MRLICGNYVLFIFVININNTNNREKTYMYMADII